jgi:hypothetical protein
MDLGLQAGDGDPENAPLALIANADSREKDGVARRDALDGHLGDGQRHRARNVGRAPAAGGGRARRRHRQRSWAPRPPGCRRGCRSSWARSRWRNRCARASTHRPAQRTWRSRSMPMARSSMAVNAAAMPSGPISISRSISSATVRSFGVSIRFSSAKDTTGMVSRPCSIHGDQGDLFALAVQPATPARAANRTPLRGGWYGRGSAQTRESTRERR